MDATLEPKVQKRSTFRLRRFLSTLGPGLITGASDDDPSGIGTYSQAGAQLGVRRGLDHAAVLPADDGNSGDLGTHRTRDRSRHRRERLPQLRSSLHLEPGAPAVRRQHHQHRRRSWRHGRRLEAPHRRSRHRVRGAVRRDLGPRPDLLRLRQIRIRAEVADAQPIRLRDRARCRRSALDRGAQGLGHSARELQCRISHHARRHPRHDNLALSFHLAIGAGGREGKDRPGKTPLREDGSDANEEYRRIRLDTLIGMAFSNLIGISIIITTAATLHAHGKTDIQSSAQAAEALKPIAGPLAELVFALGIIGTGLLAIPVLAGSAAYAIGEGRRWKVGLSRKPKAAVAFYTVLAFSGLCGIALNFTPIDPIQA